jgi:hypothetical protein
VLRTAFRAFVATQTLLLAGLGVAAAVALTPGLARLPQAIAGLALGLGLLSVYPTVTHALGARTLYAWLSRSHVAHDGIEAHRPFQLAAALLALLASAVVRTPGWLGAAIPAAHAELLEDLAAHGLAETLVVWAVVGVVAAALLVLVLAFALVAVLEALRPAEEPLPAAAAANTTVLWNVLAAGVLASAELPGLFGDEGHGPGDWRWWVALLLALALARRVLVISLLFAYERLEIPLDATLAARALPVRIPTRATALALALTCALQLGLEQLLGVAGAAAVIVVASSPAAWLLERACRGARTG